MSWKESRGGSIDLKEVVSDIAKALDVSHDIHITPNRIWVRIGDAEAAMQNWDAYPRLFLWIGALSAVPLAFHVESLNFARSGLGVCTTAFIVSGLGLICRAHLDSGFESRVKIQLDLRAKAKAVDMEELAAEAIVALWAIQNRPWLSTFRKMHVNPFALDNNINLGVADPLRRALKLVAETKAGDRGSWTQRNYYDQLVEGAATRAEAFRKAWFRTVAIPTWICRFVFPASGFIGFLALIYPYVQSVLNSMGR